MPETASKITLAPAVDLQEDAASTALASSQEDSEGDSQKANPQKITWADVSDSDDEDEETLAERNEVHGDGWTTVGSRTKAKQSAARPTVAPGRSWASVVSEAKRPGRDVNQKPMVAQQDTSKWHKERQHRGWHESSGGTSRRQTTEHQNKAMSRSSGSNAQEQQKKKADCEGNWQEHRLQPKPRADDPHQKPRSADHKGRWQDQQEKSSNRLRKGGEWQEQRKRSEKPASTDDWLSKRMGAAAA